jgi:tyrosine-protein phosphatase SIW14
MAANKLEEDVEYLAPENFSMVEVGVYRSAFPRTKNLEFLKNLNLKSVVSLVPEDYPTAMLDFYTANGIELLSHGLDGNKWPFKEIDKEGLQRVLQDILDPARRPLLIHCNKGKHRTGTVCGSLRKIRGWALSSIFNEYLLFAAPKSRLEDQQMIETFRFQYPTAPQDVPNEVVPTLQSDHSEQENAEIGNNNAPPNVFVEGQQLSNEEPQTPSNPE